MVQNLLEDLVLRGVSIWEWGHGERAAQEKYDRGWLALWYRQTAENLSRSSYLDLPAFFNLFFWQHWSLNSGPHAC
jgi:hypothetical protein